MAQQCTPEELALAAPLRPEEVTIEAWYMDDSDADQRLPHKQTPNKPVSGTDMASLGVLVWRLSGDDHENDPQLAAIRKARNYSYHDVITCCPDKLPNYEEKIKSFYEEHLHGDEEIRYILDGSGYFDVRDPNENWIRVHTKKGDMIAVPEGIWHRFTLDEGNHIVAMRLFVGFPVWTPFNRSDVGEAHESRVKYLQSLEAAQAVEAAA